MFVLNRLQKRLEEKTRRAVEILQEVYPEDNRFTAKASLEDMGGREIMYTSSRFLVLDRFQCANSNYNYLVRLEKSSGD